MTIAKTLGFERDDALEILEREFERLHNGVGVENYILKFKFEDTKKKLKDYKDNQIHLLYLPYYESILDKKSPPTTKELHKHWGEVEKNKQLIYENRIKRIRSRIVRVNEQDYKRWYKIAAEEL